MLNGESSNGIEPALAPQTNSKAADSEGKHFVCELGLMSTLVHSYAGNAGASPAVGRSASIFGPFSLAKTVRTSSQSSEAGEGARAPAKD